MNWPLTEKDRDSIFTTICKPDLLLTRKNATFRNQVIVEI